MQTECSAGAYEFPASCGRRVVARFDGGRMSSDGGVILVKQADDILGLSRRFAACFRDKRHPGFVEYIPQSRDAAYRENRQQSGG
ncbi:hypothetical protein DB34_00005 [Acetobacter pasteurianus]|nr:hypothetical protein DB34_00005 [Acetobacter pasteurianus]